MSREQFEANVARIIEYIHAGDAYQVVPSQRWTRAHTGRAVQHLPRAAGGEPERRTCTSSTSRTSRSSAPAPEPLLTVNGRHVSTRPIAGTRPRGEDDAAIAAELLADEKERSEHVMLVDLGRNDLGRVCEHGSVHVERLMEVETYSHVIHIVSQVAGTLRRGRRARSTRCAASCPAGTLSGAPKIRAMEIIDELEPVKRGAYGGAVGWLSYAGELDTCICIRTVVTKDGLAHIQAGGGTVADAKPDYEYEESRAKARRRREGDRARGQAGGVAMRVLMVDNYDSFTYNLVQYLGELGADLEVVRNDVATVDELLANDYDRVVVSPGPCTPNEAGISVEAMRRFPEAGVRTLGVCLGHQSMGQAFGGKVIRHLPVHGKTTEITHDGEGIFAGLPNPLPVARYHSLVVHDDLPGRARGHRPRRRRADGDAPQDAARDRRAVPSRVRAHARRQATARELPADA